MHAGSHPWRWKFFAAKGKATVWDTPGHIPPPPPASGWAFQLLQWLACQRFGAANQTAFDGVPTQLLQRGPLRFAFTAYTSCPPPMQEVADNDSQLTEAWDGDHAMRVASAVFTPSRSDSQPSLDVVTPPLHRPMKKACGTPEHWHPYTIIDRPTAAKSTMVKRKLEFPKETTTELSTPVPSRALVPPALTPQKPTSAIYRVLPVVPTKREQQPMQVDASSSHAAAGLEMGVAPDNLHSTTADDSTATPPTSTPGASTENLSEGTGSEILAANPADSTTPPTPGPTLLEPDSLPSPTAGPANNKYQAYWAQFKRQPSTATLPATDKALQTTNIRHTGRSSNGSPQRLHCLQQTLK